MDDTPHLKLPYIMAAQAQKHITHNEAIRILDVIVQLSVADRDLGTPPLTPQDGDRYLIAAGAIDDWSGREDQLAAFQDNAWSYHQPVEGWLCWVADEDKLLAFDGGGWSEVAGGGSASVNPALLVGVNATADTTSRLSVSSPASLFSHEGNGHQVKINKNSVADTGSVLFQNGFSGRAEMGLTGDDDYHFKVSADGSIWKEAILVDKDTGYVSFPNGSSGGSGGATQPPTMQVFSTSATWNRPAGCKSIKVTIVGGGGGGGGCNTGGGVTGGAGGGAGGGVAIEYIDVSALATEAVTVGLGGVANVGASGGNGSTTSFGSHCSASGGGGGGNAGPGSGGAGGSPGVGGASQVDIGGGWGASGSYVAGAALAGGGGGSTMTGGGGAGGAGGYPGRDGTGYGGGGGGAEALTASGTSSGGSGTTGIVIVEEYY